MSESPHRVLATAHRRLNRISEIRGFFRANTTPVSTMSIEEPVIVENRGPPAVVAGRENRLRGGALGIPDISASTMANIGPAMSFFFGFGLIATTAGPACCPRSAPQRSSRRSTTWPSRGSRHLMTGSPTQPSSSWPWSPSTRSSVTAATAVWPTGSGPSSPMTNWPVAGLGPPERGGPGLARRPRCG